MGVLKTLRIDPRRIDTALADLRQALEGHASFLPVPAPTSSAAINQANRLMSTQRAGEEIDPSIAVVVATSGSTGTPKGAQLTARNLTGSASATHRVLGGPGRWLLALPPHHIAGLQILIRSIVADTQPVAVDVSGGMDTATFALAAKNLKDTSPTTRLYTSLVPLQLAKLIDHLDGIEALRIFDAILLGGGRIDPKLKKAGTRLGLNLVTTYGCSETAGGCVYDGRPLPGTTVDIDDAGRIYLGGDTIAAGYRFAGNATDEFTARPGYFATSDAGEFTGDGLLTVKGRIDSVIDTGGLKIHPEILEDTVLETPGVRAVCVVGIPDERFGHVLSLAYEGEAAPFELVAAFEDYPRWMLPKDIVKMDPLPVTGPGKPDRLEITRRMIGRRS